MDQLELWGQIGATLYLTPEEADAFHDITQSVM